MTQDVSEISFSELTQLVAGFLLDSNPPHEDLRISVNQQTQVIGFALELCMVKSSDAVCKVGDNYVPEYLF